MIVLDASSRIIGTTTMSARLDADSVVSILPSGLFNRVYRTCHIEAPGRGLQTYLVAAVVLQPNDDPAELPGWHPAPQPWTPEVRHG